MPTLNCSCGASLKTKEGVTGIKCPKCGAKVKVPKKRGPQDKRARARALAIEWWESGDGWARNDAACDDCAKALARGEGCLCMPAAGGHSPDLICESCFKDHKEPWTPPLAGARCAESAEAGEAPAKPALRGGGGEPYCSQACCDTAGRFIGVNMFSRGACGFCGERPSSSLRIFLLRGRAFHVCANCEPCTNRLFGVLNECFGCGKTFGGTKKRDWGTALAKARKKWWQFWK